MSIVPAPNDEARVDDEARAVIFDLWDTLTRPSAQANRRQSTAEVGALPGADGPDLSQLVGDTWTERSRGAPGDLEATLRELSRRPGHCPPGTQLEAAERHRMATQPLMLQLRPEVEIVLAHLRIDDWCIGLLTDSTCETEALWRDLDIGRRFDAVAFSCSYRRQARPRLLLVAGRSARRRGPSTGASTSPTAGPGSWGPPARACGASGCRSTSNGLTPSPGAASPFPISGRCAIDRGLTPTRPRDRGPPKSPSAATTSARAARVAPATDAARCPYPFPPRPAARWSGSRPRSRDSGKCR